LVTDKLDIMNVIFFHLIALGIGKSDVVTGRQPVLNSFPI
jgi:hypothetical protein